MRELQEMARQALIATAFILSTYAMFNYVF